MDFDHRKLLSSKKNSNTNYTHVVTAESFFADPAPAPPAPAPPAPTPCPYSSPPAPPRPQPLSPPTRSDVVDPNHASKTTMMIMSFAFGGALLLGIICIVSRIYFIKRRNARRQISQAMLFATHQDFLDGDQGPGINHHIWLINTIGLQQSVIDSITTFRYKKDERLIDGTDCSVCLSEFQEGETLRLLPKCSHAFHIPCIDTWLTSHKNCPICRAPIVSDNFVAQVALPVPTRDLSSREETQMENSDNTSDSRSSNRAEDGASDVRNGDDFTIHSLLIEDAANAGNSSMNSDRSVLRNPRIRSDLVYNIELVVGAEMQPMRRSVSLDLADASEIYGLMGDAVPEKCQVNSDSLLIQPKRPKSKAHAKRGSSGNLSFHKLMKNSDRSVPRNARIPSDLVDNKHLVPEAEMQPKRRSVSFDLDNASEINGMMASVVPGKCQANSDSLLIQPKRPKSKRGSSGNLSLQKLMKSSSRGRSLQKGPVSMKRSLSTSGRSRCSDAMIQSYPSDDEILICSDGKPSVSG